MQGKSVSGNGHPALFNVHGSDHAIDDTCPHEDGPLGVGALAAAASAGPVHAYESHVTSGD